MQYLDNLECVEFIVSVFSVWDEFIVLNGQIGDYVIFV